MVNQIKFLVPAFILAILLAWAPPACADPEVDDHYPERNDKNVPVNVIIRVEFSDDMDEESVKDGFTLRDEDGDEVGGDVTYDGDSRQAYFEPDRPLQYDTRYRVKLSSSIEDQDGDELDYHSFYFTTVLDATVYVDDVEVVGDTISVNRSPVEIVVYAPGAEKVVYGDEQLKNRVNDYYLEDVMLETGDNNFSFEVFYEYEDEDSETREGKFTVKKTVLFVNVPEEGATAIHDLNDSNKATVFNKRLVINLPKHYYLREKNGAAESQLIAFKLERLFNVNGSPTVSYLFNIAHVYWRGDEYRFDRFLDQQSRVSAPPGGEMTLPLENISEAAFRTVTVLYDPYDGVYNNWQNIGGQADAGKKTITVPFKGFGRYVAVNRLWSFRDGDGPARPYVEYLWAKGIISPSSSAAAGKFGLVDQEGRDTCVTRGEFALMLGRALKLELPQNYVGFGTFSDILYSSGYSYGFNPAGQFVPLPRDAALYIEATAKNGFMSGKREKDGRFTFGYFEGLTREQAAMSVVSAAGLPVGWSNDRQTRMQLSRRFKDYQKISTLGGPYVLAAVQKGYLNAYDDWTFRPHEKLTRSDAAVMVYKLMEGKNLL
ncbi:MAG: Ig-like domain-containing protein [Firmicutes bacterium]|nr:Ig-like domain-containing protein [Bacillota bacterium]